MGIVFHGFRLILFDIYPHPSQNHTPETRRWFPGVYLIAWRGPSRLQFRTVPLLLEFLFLCVFPGSQSDVPTKVFPIISSGLGHDSKRIPCASLPALCLATCVITSLCCQVVDQHWRGGLRWRSCSSGRNRRSYGIHVFCISGKRHYQRFSFSFGPISLSL